MMVMTKDRQARSLILYETNLRLVSIHLKIEKLGNRRSVECVASQFGAYITLFRKCPRSGLWISLRSNPMLSHLLD